MEKRMVSVALALLAALVLAAGCASPTGDSGKKGGTITVPITKVTLSSASLTLEVGASASLTAKLEPANTNEALVWTSSDDTVASVSSGLVTGKKVGRVTVTGASPSDGNTKATCQVTVAAVGSQTSIDSQFTFFNQAGVNPDSTPALPMLVSGVLTLANTNTDSSVKTSVEKNTMVVFNTPMNGDFLFRAQVKITYRTGASADRGVTVAAYAKTAGEFGTTPPMAGFLFRNRGDLRSYYHNGSAYSAGSPNLEITSLENTWDVERILEVKRTAATGYTFTVKVPKTGLVVASGSADVPNASLNPAVTGTSPVYLALTSGGTTVDFANIEVYDSLAVGATPVYKSSPVVAAGPVPLKGIAITGMSKYAFSPYEYLNYWGAMTAGDKAFQLAVAATPAYADNKTVAWKSSAETVATVDPSGNVVILKDGNATITATSAEGGFEANYRICVTAEAIPVSSVAITGPSTLMVGLKSYPTANIQPATASVKTLNWESSDTTKATVDPVTGVVTALADGPVTITATATDGSLVKATLDMTVTPYSTAIWSWNSATDAAFDATTAVAQVRGINLVRGGGTVTGTSSGIVLNAARFNLGTVYVNSSATLPTGAMVQATSASANVPDGQLNFTKKAKVTVNYSAATATTGFSVYIDNNTTGETASPIFKAEDTATPAIDKIGSKLFADPAATGTDAPTLSLTGGTLTFTVDPAYFLVNPKNLEKSFLQFRTSAVTLTISSITVEYID